MKNSLNHILSLLKKQSIILVTSSLVLSSCETGNKQNIGMATGAVAGGLLGSTIGNGSGKFAATGLGMILGAAIGGSIGAQMDMEDKKRMQYSTQQALENAPSGHVVKWRNPDSGHYGYVTPVRTYQEYGEYCREFTQEVVIGGQKQKAYGKACRRPDGQWQIISN